MNPLAEQLERVLAIVETIHERDSSEVVERTLDRLSRDLLPRTAGESPHLVAGIVGPNNAGKTSLFNTIAGWQLSPVAARGGFTRGMVGVAHPALLERLRRNKRLARFPIVEVGGPGTDASEHAQATPDPPELLAIATSESIVDGLLAIDTPDFDSIVHANQKVSDSLLAVADLALVVVTPVTYQNEQLLDHFRGWLTHGRPWILIYNKGDSDELARAHAAKLAQDWRSEPLAVFAASKDPAATRGGHVVPNVRSLGGGSVPAGVELRDFLFDLESLEAVKGRALEASLGQLGDDLLLIADGLEQRAQDARALFEAVEKRAYALATEACSQAMPAGPLVEAFRKVLDARADRVSRGFRSKLRDVRVKLESLPSLFRRTERAETPAEVQLAAIEGAQLHRRWPAFFESVSRDFGPAGTHALRGRAGAELTAALDADLDPGRLHRAMTGVAAGLPGVAVELGEFERACEELVAAAIESRGRDWDMQLSANLVMLAPLAITAVIIVKTGGFGADLGVVGGGAATSFLTEKFSPLLGSGVTRAAAKRWAALRAEQVVPVLVRSALASASARLQDQIDDESLAKRLRELRKELP